MGGNLFTGRRLLREDYDDISNEVTQLLLKEGVIFSVVPFYRDKYDFGDLDIVVSSKPFSPEIIYKLFGKETKFKKNSNVISISFRDFQIDLIFMPSELYISALNYYAWNDIGNLIGRIFHKTGMKYGHKGLLLIMRDNSYIEEILITRDINKILPLIGLDVEKYQRGFDSKEDIFQYVASSPYFNKEIYLLENKSHISRIRDKKRKMYSGFLEWVSTQDSLPSYPWKSLKEHGGYQENQEWLNKIFKQFPEVKKKYNEIKGMIEKNKLVKSKFSGVLVSSITGLTREKLGKFIALLKSKEGFFNFIIQSDIIDIVYWIDYEFKRERNKYHQIK